MFSDNIIYNISYHASRGIENIDIMCIQIDGHDPTSCPECYQSGGIGKQLYIVVCRNLATRTGSGSLENALA
jgi:hypothetical protein